MSTHECYFVINNDDDNSNGKTLLDMKLSAILYNAIDWLRIKEAPTLFKH